MSKDEGTATVATRIPDSWIAAMDAKANQLEASNGMPFSRSDIVRMSLARYLGLVDPPPESSGDREVAGS